MKRILLSLLLSGVISLAGFAQQSVSIGTDQINNNAVLWLQGNGSQGLILPVVTNRTAVTATRGMIVFDDSDKKVYYNNGTIWVEVGGGGAGVAQTLTLSGNTLSISGGNSVQIASTTPTLAGQLLQWNGTQWTSSNAATPTTGQVLKWNGISWAPGTDDAGGASILLNNGQLLTGNGTANAATTITGDVTLSGSALTISNNAVNSAKIADGSILGADLNSMSATNGQVLKFNGTTWVPAADDAGVGATPTLSNGQILTGNGTTNSATALSGDATLNGGTLTIANNAINSAKIADGSVASAEIADGTIIANDLNSMGATTGQVLQFNGTLWNPATIATGSGTVTNVSGTGPVSVTTPTTTPVISISQANGTTNGFLLSTDWAAFNAKLGTASTTAGDLSGTIISPTVVGIQGRAVTSTVPTNGQILKFNGTSWAPAADDVGGGATPTLSNGQILIGDGSSNSGVAMSGDATLSAGALTIANNAINSAKISDGSIVDADVNAAAAIAGSKIIPDFGAQNISTTGNTSTSQLIISNEIRLGANPGTSGQILTSSGPGTVPAWTTPSGSGTVTNVSVTTANGVSGTVATSTTTPAITLSLGAITPTSVAATGTVSGSNLSGTNTGDQTTITGNAGSATALQTGRSISLTGDVNYTSPSFDGTSNVTAAATVARINGNTVPANAAGALTNDGSGNLIWAPTGSGTVTSVGLTLPSIFSVAGSPVTTTGTLAATLASQPAATVFAAPTASAGAPTFRALAATDIPALDASKITTGTLPIAQGGTGATTPGAALANLGAMNNTLPAGEILVGNASNIATGVAVSGDATMSSAGTLTVGNNAINSAKIADGSIVDADVNAAAAIAGTKVAPNFGAQNVATTGSGTFSQLIISDEIILGADPGTAGQVLTSAGAGTVPTWSTLAGASSLQSAYDGGNTITLAASPIDITGTGGQAAIRVNDSFIESVDTGDDDNAWFRSTSGTSWLFGANNLVHNGGFGIGTFGDMLMPPFFIDPVNKNIGLGGQTAPSSTLDVAGDIEFSGALLPNNLPGTSGDILSSAGPGLPPVWITPSGSTLITNPGTRNLFAGAPIGTTSTGTDNAFYGSGAGDANSSGSWNVLIGSSAGAANTIGFLNTLIGWRAGAAATNNAGNTFIGAQAGESTTENVNTFIGEKAGQANTFGSENVFVGNSAGITNANGGRNTIIGTNANVGAAALQNASAIGYRAFVNQSNSLVLGGINGVNGASANTNVGIGTSTPSTNLEVQSTTNTRIRITTTSAGNQAGVEMIDGTSSWRLTTNAISGGARMDESTDAFAANSSIRFQFSSAAFEPGASGTQALGSSIYRWSTLFATNGTINTSDRRLKKDERAIKYGLQEILKLEPVSFKWKNENTDTRTHLGLMAQDVLKIIPEAVIIGEDEEKTLGLSYSDLVPVLIKSVQELNSKIEALESENQKLKSEKGSLESKVSEIEAQQQALAKSLDEIKRLLGAEAKK